MIFSKILKRKADTPEKGVDVFCMVNGKPSNQQICEDMLGDDKQSPEVTAYIVDLAKKYGFSDEDAQKFWGNT